MHPEFLIEKFARESNLIEGEIEDTLDNLGMLNPGDIEAIKYVIQRPLLTEEDILTLHKMLGEHLGANWVGKYRDCMVRVGYYIPPKPEFVPKLMKDFFRQLPGLNSWKAHNKFEKIHPFQDLNGRMGRLIWLNKALREGYNLEMSFLHKYYYQTLNFFSGTFIPLPIQKYVFSKTEDWK